MNTHTHTYSVSTGHHFAILWASVGNTIPAAFWVIYYLLAYPEAFAAVKSEIQEVLGIKGDGLALNDDITLTTEDLDRMIYLGTVHTHTHTHANTLSHIHTHTHPHMYCFAF